GYLILGKATYDMQINFYTFKLFWAKNDFFLQFDAGFFSIISIQCYIFLSPNIFLVYKSKISLLNMDNDYRFKKQQKSIIMIDKGLLIA
ncbi:hypothetical protein ACJX0J_008931, partial [Zea mays]